MDAQLPITGKVSYETCAHEVCIIYEILQKLDVYN